MLATKRLNPPPDVVFAQKATAIVKAAGMNPRLIDLERFRQNAALVFSRAYSAIYKEELLSVLNEHSSKDDKILNSQLVLDGLFTKTRNPILLQISGLEIYQGSHKAIGILVGVLFAEGQRLWLEKVKVTQNSNLPIVNIVSERVEADPLLNDCNNETDCSLDGDGRAIKDSLQTLIKMRNKPDLSPVDLERLLCRISFLEEQLERKRVKSPKKSSKKNTTKPITEAILQDDQLSEHAKLFQRSLGDEGINDGDSSNRTSPRSARAGNYDDDDDRDNNKNSGKQSSSKSEGGGGGGRQRPVSAPNAKTGAVRRRKDRIRPPSSRLYNAAMISRTHQMASADNGPTSPSSPQQTHYNGNNNNNNMDAAMYTYDWKSGRKILLSQARKEYEERRRLKENMNNILNSSDGEEADNRHSSHNYNNHSNSCKSEYPNKSIGGDVEKWLIKMRRHRLGDSGEDNSGGGNSHNSSSGSGKKSIEDGGDYPDAKQFSAYRKLGRGDLVISIEYCHNCEHHNVSLRHDPAEYLRNTVIYMRMLAQIAHECGVCARVGVTRFKANITPGSQLTDTDSRIGAFEIQAAYRNSVNGGGALIPIILHSKLLTRRWPSKSVLEKRFRAFVAKASIATTATLEREDGEDINYATGDSVEPYPVGISSWSDSPLSSVSWDFTLTECRKVIKQSSDANVATGDGNNNSSNSTGLSRVQWAFDTRSIAASAQAAQFGIGSTIRVKNLQYAAANTSSSSTLSLSSSAEARIERHALLAVVKEYVQPNDRLRSDLIVKPKYHTTEVQVVQSDCISLASYYEQVGEDKPEYVAGVVPTALEALIILAREFHLIDWEVGKGDEIRESSGDIILSRASLYTQLRRLSWSVEHALARYTTTSNSDVQKRQEHPITGELVDIQLSYSEEVLDWIYRELKGDANVSALERMVKIHDNRHNDNDNIDNHNSTLTSSATAASSAAAALSKTVTTTISPDTRIRMDDHKIIEFSSNTPAEDEQKVKEAAALEARLRFKSSSNSPQKPTGSDISNNAANSSNNVSTKANNSSDNSNINNGKIIAGNSNNTVIFNNNNNTDIGNTNIAVNNSSDINTISSANVSSNNAVMNTQSTNVQEKAAMLSPVSLINNPISIVTPAPVIAAASISTPVLNQTTISLANTVAVASPIVITALASPTTVASSPSPPLQASIVIAKEVAAAVVTITTPVKQELPPPVIESRIKENFDIKPSETGSALSVTDKTITANTVISSSENPIIVKESLPVNNEDNNDNAVNIVDSKTMKIAPAAAAAATASITTISRDTVVQALIAASTSTNKIENTSSAVLTRLSDALEQFAEFDENDDEILLLPVTQFTVILRSFGLRQIISQPAMWDALLSKAKSNASNTANVVYVRQFMNWLRTPEQQQLQQQQPSDGEDDGYGGDDAFENGDDDDVMTAAIPERLQQNQILEPIEQPASSSVVASTEEPEVASTVPPPIKRTSSRLRSFDKIISDEAHTTAAAMAAAAASLAASAHILATAHAAAAAKTDLVPPPLHTRTPSMSTIYEAPGQHESGQAIVRAATTAAAAAVSSPISAVSSPMVTTAVGMQSGNTSAKNTARGDATTPTTGVTTTSGNTPRMNTARSQLSAAAIAALMTPEEKAQAEEKEQAYRKSLHYKNQEMEVSLIVIEGEHLVHAHYDTVSVVINIKDKEFIANQCMSREKGSKRRSYNLKWPDIFVSADSFRNDNMFITVVITDASLFAADPKLPYLDTTMIGESTNSVPVPLYRFMQPTFDVHTEIQLESSLGGTGGGSKPLLSSGVVKVTIQGYTREAKDTRNSRIMSMRPADLLNIKFDPMPLDDDGFDEMSDDDDDGSDSNSVHKIRRAGGATTTMNNNNNKNKTAASRGGGDDDELTRTLFPKASILNMNAMI